MGQASTGTAGTFLKSSSVTLGSGMRHQGSTTSPTTAISFDVLWTPLGIQTHDVLSAWTVYGQPVGRPWSPGRVRRPAKKARPITRSYTDSGRRTRLGFLCGPEAGRLVRHESRRQAMARV